MRAIAGVLLIAASIIALVMYLRGGQETVPPGPLVPRSDGTHPIAFAPDTVLRIEPRSATPRPAVPVSRQSALAVEMQQARAWKPIYDRLSASPEGKTPEGLYYLAQILESCANVTDRKGPPRPPPASPEETLAKFMASISEKDPNRGARIAAYESAAAMRSERCANLREVPATQKEIRELRAQAVAAGEPKASAVVVADEVFATTKPLPMPAGLPTITDAQLETLRQAARSGDPDAIRMAGSVLASTMGDLSIRAGPHEQPIEARAFYDAWMLVACDAGANCGATSGVLASACAYQGQCGVDNLRDYYFYYESSPARAQQMTEYTQQLQNAIRSGDWSYFQFVRAAPPGASQSMFQFRSGP